jgi:ABC-2 type transport system ATP-binding protein
LIRKHEGKKIQKLLEDVGIEDAASTQLRKFSRGMLQRIGIAQALINDPELVILDEPLSGLDPIGRKEIRDIILRLKKEGRTVVFSSHILSDAEAICDRIGILMQGRLQHVERLSEFHNIGVESVEITASALSEAGREAIRSTGSDVVASGDKTVILIHGVSSSAGEQMISKVLATVRESGGKAVSMMSRTRSLEDLFLEYSQN